MYDNKFPADSFTTSLIEVNGDINKRAHGDFLDAKYVAAPVPIDRPNNINDDSGIP